MNNIKEIVNSYENICLAIRHRYLDGFYKNIGKIEKACSLFTDIDSVTLYKQEIIFCMLRNFLNGDKASFYSGLMSNNEWIQYVNNALRSDFFEYFTDWLNEVNKITSFGGYFSATTFLLEQYKYKDIVRVQDGDICIDCGACLGDTSLYMNKCGASKIYSFEIDVNNIKFIQNFLNKFNIKNISLINNAVSDKNTTMFYKPDKNNIGAGRVLNEKTDDSYEVESCTIDEFCSINNIAPSFIKMDIEGAEKSAINGAKSIIKKYKPKLAICIYHSWNDRFEIPLLINSIVPEYEFYLKKSHPSCETVLLCTTKERREIKKVLSSKND